MTPIINYDALVQELEKGLSLTQNTSAYNLIPGLEMSKDMVLREYYTVGFTLPRQTGSSFFILKEMIKDPQSTCVFVSESLMNLQLAILKEIISAAKENRDISIRGVTYMPMDPGLKKLVLDQPDLLNSMRKRCGTTRWLFKMIDSKEKFLEGMSKIYLDGSSAIFNQVRRKKYYTWLAEHSEDCIQTWVIN